MLRTLKLGSFLGAAAATFLILAPFAAAQTPVDNPPPPEGPSQGQGAFTRYPQPRFMQEDYNQTRDQLFYGGIGFAWSGELGVELEAGVQTTLGDFLQLRFSPFNFSVFDGDRILYDSSSDYDYYDDCYDDYDDDFSYAYFCDTEPDAEWRSIAEAQLRLGDFALGGGAAYVVQGLTPGKDRLASFLTFASKVDSESALELRIGEDYSAFRIVGAW